MTLGTYSLSACLSAVTSSFSATLIDSDFGEASTPVLGRSGKPSPTFRGVLPKGWREDTTGWTTGRATCEVMAEEGEEFLRINILEAEAGRVQFCFEDLPDVTGRAYHRLTVKFRNRATGAVVLGLRMRGKPYQMYWEKRGKFATEWATRIFDFELGKNGKPMGLWLNIYGTGIVDIATLRLDRLTKAELIAAMKEKYPDGGPKNLFRNSRLPLGLQSGWMLDRACSDGDVVGIEPDASVPTLTNAPALRIESVKQVVLTGEPCGLALPVLKHRLALWVRGRGEWRFGAHVDRVRRAEQDLTLADGHEWHHVALVFQPRLMTKTVAVRIEGSGTLWIAGLRLCPDEMPAGYVPAGELEVALACPKSDGSPARIQFDDEPAKVRYCVTGKGSGARLKANVVNVYGESKVLAHVPLANDDTPRYGTFDFDVFKGQPRGGFRIEAWVERGGERVSPLNELVVYRLRRPRYWGKDAPHSPFGAHFMSSTRRIVMMKAIGVNWARFHDAGLEYIGWFWLEPEQGKWAFRDEDIARYRKHRIKIFAELGTAPRWASYLSEADTGRKHIAYHDRYFQPKNLAEYANYCRTVVKRYRGVIDAYFVWNEPWIHAWWGRGYDTKKGGREGYLPSAEPQKDFVALMRTAYDSVKSIDGDILVSGVNTTTSKGFGSRSISGNEWTKGIIEHGGLQHCDLMDYHQYTPSLNGFPGDSVEAGLNWAIGPTRDENGRAPKPVWMSEGQGTNGRHAEAMYKHTVPYPHSDDYVDVANRLARYNLSMLANRVQKVFLYSAHGHGWLGGRNQWSVLVTPDGYAHPSAAAHSTLAWHLEDTTFREMIEVADGVYAYLFDGKGRSVAVVSSKEKFGEYVIPNVPRMSVEDLFGNPLPVNTRFDGKLVYLSWDGGVAELKAALKTK